MAEERVRIIRSITPPGDRKIELESKSIGVMKRVNTLLEQNKLLVQHVHHLTQPRPRANDMGCVPDEHLMSHYDRGLSIKAISDIIGFSEQRIRWRINAYLGRMPLCISAVHKGRRYLAMKAASSKMALPKLSEEDLPHLPIEVLRDLPAAYIAHVSTDVIFDSLPPEITSNREVIKRRCAWKAASRFARN